MNPQGLCDQMDLNAYVDGELGDSECRLVERHAFECEYCRNRIESALAPTASTLRRALAPDSPPQGLFERVEALRNERRRFLWTARLAVASIVLSVTTGLAYYWSSSTELTVIEGTVLINGQRLASSQRVFRGATITAIGPARLRLGNEEVLILDAWGQFDLMRTWGHTEVSRIISPIYISHDEPRPSTEYRVGRARIKALGTRFGIVGPDPLNPTLTVLQHQIKVSTEDGSVIVREGRALGQGHFASEDPNRFATKRLQSVPGLGDRPEHMVTDDPLPQEVAQRLLEGSKRVVENPDQAGPFLAIARALSDAEEHGSMGWVLSRAVELDPDLRSATTRELEYWMAHQAAFGVAGVEHRLFVAVRAREAPIDYAAWGTLLSSNRSPAKAEAALRLLESSASSVTIPLAYIAFDNIRADASFRSSLAVLAARIGAHLRSNPDLSPRARAIALQTQAECLYFDPGREIESLEPLREAVSLWRTHHRLIHYLTRLAETGQLGSMPNAREQLLGAFFAHPSYLNAERVLVFLQTAAHGSKVRESILRFAHWIGQTFDTLVPAQMLAAGAVQEESPQVALRYIRRAMEIAQQRPDLLPAHQARLAAELEWRASASKSDRLRTRLANEYHLNPGDVHEEEGVYFFVASGDFASALLALKSEHRLDESGRSFLRARILADLDRPEEAIPVLRSFLHSSHGSNQPLDIAEARVLLAELLLQSDPKWARETAERALNGGLPGIDQGWRKYRRYDLMYRARALAVLGRYGEACTAQRQFLDACAVLPDRDAHVERLRQWGEQIATSSR